MQRRSLAPLLLGLVATGCARPAPPPPPPPIPPPVVLAPPVAVPRQLDLAVFADSRVNPDAAGRAAPVAVRLYLLRADTAFITAGFFALFDREQATLGGDLLARDEWLLRPGQASRISKALSPDARHLAILIAYRDIERSTWRAVRRLPPAPAPAPPPIREPVSIPMTLIIGESAPTFANDS